MKEDISVKITKKIDATSNKGNNSFLLIKDVNEQWKIVVSSLCGIYLTEKDTALKIFKMKGKKWTVI